jgi:hypothetical protein
MDAERRGIRRRGFWERLLCLDCERRIGRWESYFADFSFQRGVRPKPVIRGNRLLRVSGLDYRQFKLFHLSILWRSGVSSLGPFKDVRLGGHQERLRTMLLNEDPGPAHTYPLSAIAMCDDDGGYKDDLVQLPRAGKFKGHHCYSALFGGVFWLYRVSSHSQGWPVPSLLSNDGTLLLAAQHWTTHKSVLEAAAGIHRVGRVGRSGPTHQ